MRSFFTYLFLMVVSTNGCAQVKMATPSSDSSSNQAVLSPVQIIKGNYDKFEVDAIGNVYLLHEGQLKKISPAGDSLAVFNDVRRFGQPTTLDVTNPFKTLLYYKQFATVVLLDNMLSNRGVVNLRKTGIFTVDAIGMSYDNKVWVFDEQDFKLKKIDEDGKILSESNDLRQAALIAPQPDLLFDSDGTVFLYDADLGFVLLDHYGTYLKTLPFKGWQSVSVSKNTVLGFGKDKLLTYELKSLQVKEYKLPGNFAGMISVRTMGGKIYLHKKEAIEVYMIP
ncbi:MAG: hypothetical protein EOO01_13085 [Chitinophagaceae bacterium]|nr:MAG: hypothetical protein EOO01_13085 [Chitinophagaceae bacterium]